MLDRIIEEPYPAFEDAYAERARTESDDRWMSWQEAVETAVRGLGYELVDAEKSAGGLLRVFIDHPEAAAGASGTDVVASHCSAEGNSDPRNGPDSMAASDRVSGAAVPDLASSSTSSPAAADRFITVEDCERVTRQLQHVLEVEGCDYQRLEVSSPGLDRPLKKAGDYRRFVGEQVELTLKLPFKGRKKFRGELQVLGEGWRLVLPKGGGADASQQALDFELAEVREARLVPVVDFKGRRFASGSGSAPAEASPAGRDAPKKPSRAGAARTGAGPASPAGEKTDGGRIQ